MEPMNIIQVSRIRHSEFTGKLLVVNGLSRLSLPDQQGEGQEGTALVQDSFLIDRLRNRDCRMATQNALPLSPLGS